MTVAVGMLDRVRGCWIGVDSMETHGDTRRVANKLVRCHGLVAAVSGHMTLADAVRAAIEKTISGDGGHLSIGGFRANLRTEFEACAWKPETKDGQPAWRDFAFLLTDGLFLWEFSGALHARQAELGNFCAIGSGYEVALGAAHAVLTCGKALPENMVRAALDAAIAHCVYCGPPARVIHVEPKPCIQP